MRNIALTISYDGSDFAGWQIQPDARTVQGEIESVLERLLQKTIRLTGAGRTDAGVHAHGQVAAFQCESALPCQRIQAALNAMLPPDIRILEVHDKEADFHPRFDAVRRVYRYHIARQILAVGRQYVWQPRGSFELDPMIEASQALIGEHSFESFAKTGDANGNFDSVVYKIDWIENPTEVIFEIEAIRFFHNMIRIIVGTLMEVGQGRRSIEDFQRLLKLKDRTQAGKTAPPHGLTLFKIYYKESQ